MPDIERREAERRHHECSICENSWSQYSKLVLEKLETLGADVKECNVAITQIRIENAGTRTKMSTIAGVTAIIATGITQYIARMLGGR